MELQITWLPAGEVPDWLSRPTVVSRQSAPKLPDTHDGPEPTADESSSKSTSESTASESTSTT